MFSPWHTLLTGMTLRLVASTKVEGAKGRRFVASFGRTLQGRQPTTRNKKVRSGPLHESLWSSGKPSNYSSVPEASRFFCVSRKHPQAWAKTDTYLNTVVGLRRFFDSFLPLSFPKVCLFYIFPLLILSNLCSTVIPGGWF